ncbi:MAG: RNA polymerase sigma-I factor [Firmicutes bacterium]|jgi:RNA polymerase sigma factor|uniref:RNA polymerase sigma factor SigI n=1 Tax=Sulfobacillus benefaciens TaxID=453960 RepID=A0A2T2X6X1_9FIRM|nr:RNA polymerase sigma-I factor [Bacillota bacterium]MCL5013790.1 RNA polymerase sigma-I factor [Bacillota bacterium]PSR30250.1 MAG: RNA polymerase sigma-I factor [Sulfobacillus benefaciens]HBQ94712.1 RNA polymerase sigma-I factor [Sulfobacillus sp.]
MGFGLPQRRVRPPALLALAQAGDIEARNQLIDDFTPFVLKVASQSAGRYLTPGQDEEISVALLAFNEAISAYSEGKGTFLAFARTVISRRLIDHFRHQKSRFQEISLSELEREDSEGYALSAQVDGLAQEQWTTAQDDENRMYEIIELREKLKSYGISLAELPKLSPKHQDARNRSIHIGQLIAGTPPYRGYLEQKKELPLKELAKHPGITRKTLERHRKYIIAVVVILISDLPYLRSFVLDRIRGE